MNKVINSVLIVGSLALLGGACYKTIDTNVNVAGNTNVVESNLNVSINTNTETNVNTVVNTNSVVNTNTQVNTNSAIDRSDWQIYMDEQYEFSFSFPSTWVVEKEETQLNSRLYTNQKIYVLHLNDENDQVVATLFPEGQLDHGLPEDGANTTIVIFGKNVLKRDFGDYVVYSFENYPAIDSEFRIESRTSTEATKDYVETVVNTIEFKV